MPRKGASLSQFHRLVPWTTLSKLLLSNSRQLHLHLHLCISRHFYPKRLTLHSSYSFYILSALAFPGNRTHDLGVASAMLYHLSYRKAFKLRSRRVLPRQVRFYPWTPETATSICSSRSKWSLLTSQAPLLTGEREVDVVSLWLPVPLAEVKKGFYSPYFIVPKKGGGPDQTWILGY